MQLNITKHDEPFEPTPHESYCPWWSVQNEEGKYLTDLTEWPDRISPVWRDEPYQFLDPHQLGETVTELVTDKEILDMFGLSYYWRNDPRYQEEELGV